MGTGSNTNVEAEALGLRWVNMPGSPRITTGNYVWRDYVEFMDRSGVAGQNSPNPQSFFGFHSIAKFGGTYYDPSYGKTHTGAANFSINAVDGFVVSNSDWYDPLAGQVVKVCLGRKRDMGESVFPAYVNFSALQATPW